MKNSVHINKTIRLPEESIYDPDSLENNRQISSLHTPEVPLSETSEVDQIFQQGLALHQQEKLTQAVSLYQQALVLNPNHAGTLHALGLVAFQQENFHESCEYFEKAIAECSTKAVYHSNYGAALLKLGKKDEAHVVLEKALQICPDYPDALHYLGVVFMESGQNDRAVLLFEKLLNQCDSPQTIPLLIESLTRTRGIDQAFRVYRKFYDSEKIPPWAMDRIVSFFHKEKQYDFMIQVTQDVISCDGDNANRSLFLAWGYGNQENFSQAKQYYEKAAEFYGDRPFWKYKHLEYCPTIFADNQEIENYWNELNRSLDNAIEHAPTLDIKHVFQDGVMPSFNLPHLMFCCREMKEKFAALIRPSFDHYQRPKLKKTDKIRIGFFVSRGHQGGPLRSDTGLMKRLDRKRFEPVFITGQDVIKQCCKTICSDDIEYVGISDHFEEAARQIRETKCHILYHWQTCSDLMNYLIPFARCTPIQIAGFGMHGTTGTKEIDYFMSSGFQEPILADDHYTEKLFRCDEIPTWQERLPQEKFQAKRSDFALPEKGAIYFCPHRLPKFHPIFDRFLRGILESDPHGHLLILDGGNRHVVKKLHTRWEKTIGKSLMSRIITRPQMLPIDYYRLLSVSSCVLDSPCYSTSFTGFDALAMGVPLIGMEGRFMVQRYASAFYKRMNLQSFVPRNKNEYVTLAVTLANDLDFRYHFLKLVDERKEVLFENHQTVHCFEQALEQIYSKTDF